MSEINNLRYKVVSYRNGMIVSNDWCYDWLEAETIAEDRMKHPALYDEVRITNITGDKQ